MKKAVLILAIVLLAAMMLLMPTSCAACDNGDEHTVADTNDNEPALMSQEQADFIQARRDGLPREYYTTANLHLRAGPGTDYDSFELVPFGTSVQVALYYSAAWFRIRRGEHTGYMSSEFLSTNRPATPTPTTFYTTANLHLRAGPSTDTESLALLPRGTRVQVVFHSAEWFRVEHWSEAELLTGYMSSEFLTDNIASLIDPTRVDLALLWQVWEREELVRILGEPIHQQTEWEGEAVGYWTSYEFSYGISSHHGFRVEFNDDNRTLFHYNGLDGTSTRDDVIAAFGQPWEPPEDDTYFHYIIHESWVGKSFTFDSNGTVSSIHIYVSPT